ncbi:MAG: thiamine diphosphokinase [Oligoflexia bacterium]|nr:thiamine diphosphokinase [Oligoflexia bacterium]
MRHVVFVNSPTLTPSKLTHLISSNDHVVCADGGANLAAKIGVKPHAVLGDMDSISPALLAELEQLDTKVFRFPRDKDKTDLELCLDYSQSAGATSIMLLSPFGGRLDHILGNIMLLLQPRYENLAFSLSDGEVTAYLARPQQAVRVSGIVGDILSIIPLSPQCQGASLSGTRYPLTQETLFQGSSRTISNVLTAEVASFKLDCGAALLLHVPGESACTST